MRRFGGLVLVLLAMAAPCARAATPERATVGPGSPEAGWTGSLDGTASPQAYAATGGTAGLCRQPQCDTYTLTVEGSAVRLELRARANRSVDRLAVEVIEPDGTSTYVYDQADTAAFVREYPAAGVYTVHVLAGSGGGTQDIAYRGRATLVASDPPPAVVHPASPEHPSSSFEVSTPATQPAPAVPLRLSAFAARRPARRAARTGLRVRIRCSGGCSAIRVRAFVSPLTARQFGWGVVREDLEIGAVAVTERADGRIVATLSFLRRYRPRLARARRVRIAVEAVASAPDGRSATVTRRLTLRR